MAFFNMPEIEETKKGLFRPVLYEGWMHSCSFKKCRFTKDQLLSAVKYKTNEIGIIKHQRTKLGITDFPEYEI